MSLYVVEGKLSFRPQPGRDVATARTMVIFSKPVSRIIASITGFDVELGAKTDHHRSRLAVQLGVSQSSIPSLEAEIIGHLTVGKSNEQNGTSSGEITFVAIGME